MLDEETQEVREIQEFINTHLLPLGKAHDEISPLEVHIFDLLIIARQNFKNNRDRDPLILMELYLCCHEANKPQLSFVSDWLYRGMLEYHSLKGKDDLARELGLKFKTRHTPFTHHEIKARQWSLAFKIHFLHCLGGLSVVDAINKVTEFYAMDFQSLKDLYYKYKSEFKGWEEELREYQAADKTRVEAKLSTWGL
jgi:hypothetical protein